MENKLVFKRDVFFEKLDRIALAVTYGEVRLKTGYSEVLPADVDVSSKFSRNVPLPQPLASAPMDTVTEYRTAICMALSGGIGIIHRGMSLEKQCHNAERVKFFQQGGFIPKPICAKPEETVEQLLNRRKEKEYDFHSLPVIDNDGRLIGLVTGDDFDFCLDPKLKVADIMSANLITGEENIGFEGALKRMVTHKKKVLPLVNAENRLCGMYIWSDIKRTITGNPKGYNVDLQGRLRVGAAIGVGEEALQRAGELIRKGVDVLVIDTAHGNSKAPIDTLKEIKKNFGIDVVVGNISQGEAARRLVDAGADGIKVGQGPGSICTTRTVAGIGTPQVTAIHNCELAIRGSDVPIIADGGVTNPGDIPVAIAAGAACVMIGNLFAGTDEAPGDIFLDNGQPYKYYRGMGSLGAMQESQASRERYGQISLEKRKLVPEGVEGKVPYKGPLSEIFFQLIGGLRAGMGYLGAKNIAELQEKADFDRNTDAGSRESHPHNISFVKMPPNYNMGAGKTNL